MTKLTELQVTKATEWWADRICSPVFDGLSKEERRDPANEPYRLAEMLATMSIKPVGGNQREKFIAALREEIEAESYNSLFGLSVDYHPCRELAQAAKEAEIPRSNFPWKTYMHFDADGTVKAACGYGKPLETI